MSRCKLSTLDRAVIALEYCNSNQNILGPVLLGSFGLQLHAIALEELELAEPQILAFLGSTFILTREKKTSSVNNDVIVRSA